MAVGLALHKALREAVALAEKDRNSAYSLYGHAAMYHMPSSACFVAARKQAHNAFNVWAHIVDALKLMEESDHER